MVSECARPPIALMSERFAAAARCPMSAAEAQSRRKCRPSTSRSVETTHVAVADAQHGGVVARTDQHLLALREQLAERARSAGTRRPRPRWRQRGTDMAPIPPDRAPRCRRPRGRPVDPTRLRGRLSAAPSIPTTRRRHTMVVQAYILIQTDVGKAAEVARAIAQVKGVTLAEDVTGPYDVIVRAEARNVDELGKLVVVQGAEPRRHHPHPDLPGRPHLTWPDPDRRPRPGRSADPGRACCPRALVRLGLVLVGLRQGAGQHPDPAPARRRPGGLPAPRERPARQGRRPVPAQDPAGGRTRRRVG